MDGEVSSRRRELLRKKLFCYKRLWSQYRYVGQFYILKIQSKGNVAWLDRGVCDRNQ